MMFLSTHKVAEFRQAKEGGLAMLAEPASCYGGCQKSCMTKKRTANLGNYGNVEVDLLDVLQNGRLVSVQEPL